MRILGKNHGQTLADIFLFIFFPNENLPLKPERDHPWTGVGVQAASRLQRAFARAHFRPCPPFFPKTLGLQAALQV